MKRLMIGFSLMTSVATMAIQPPPPTGWEKPKVENGSVTLDALSPEVLAIHYDVMPYEKTRSGNRMRVDNNVFLMLKQPVELASDVERINFATHGVTRDIGHGAGKCVELRPVIRDRDGELFCFFPKQYIALKHRKKQGWNKFTTAAFHSGEAGAASHGTCKVLGDITNSTPDRKLELVGFELHVTEPDRPGQKIERRKGTVYLGEFTPGPLKLPFTQPNAYVGAFLDKKGEYTLAAQIRNKFQGTPTQEIRKQVSFDPADILGSRQKIEFDLGPNDHYWIDYQILDNNGEVVASDSMKYQVFGSPETQKPGRVDLTKAPPIGYMRVNPGHKGCGVYEIGEDFKINIRVFPKDQKNLKLDYVLHPYFGADVLASGSIDISDKERQDIPLEFKKTPKYNAFRLIASIKKDGKTLDKQTYFFGEKTDFSKPLVRRGNRTDRKEIKKQPYNRLSYVYLGKKGLGIQPMKHYIDDFKEYLDETSEFVRHSTICPELNDFEVLPGVYDFSLMDEMMNLAADYGCKLTVRFAHSDLHGGPYRWGKFSRQISADGVVAGDGISYGAYEVTDPQLVKLWLDAYRALYKRYNNHTAFEGYYIMKPAGEWTVVDQPWDGVVSGYSEPAVEAFRNYLKDTLKLSLAELNKRWGTAYKSFGEIQPPQPTFEQGSTPDLGMKWLDFCRFKASLNYKFWMSTAINDIRSYDKDRITITYGHPNKFSHLNGGLDYCHNGGNHSMDDRGAFYNAWKKEGIGWITEPIHPHGWAAHNDPGKGGWVLDVSTWTMIAQAGPGGANIHVYYFNKPGGMVKRYGGFYAFDRYERFKPMLRELQKTELIFQPSDTAVHQDKETLFTKHRTTFGSRLEDLKRWFELLEQDGIPYAQLNDFPDKKFKLVLPNILDEVISLDSLKKYEKAVKEDGAKMIITANTGKYVPELGTEPYQLLKALGISKPTGKYVQTGEIKAKASAGNPLFDKGREIDFQTLTSLREQAHSPEVRKAFWHYPYRWIPQTDYFGYYPKQKPNGKVLATFADGGAAMTSHQTGKGEVIVFWGTPDISSNKLNGFMARAAKWAGIVDRTKGMEVKDFVELTNPQLKRHYGLFYLEDKYGKFNVRFPHCPDGDFFCDDMVGDHKIGRFSGKDLRTKGLTLEWTKGDSPLKAIRIIPTNGIPKQWVDAYQDK